MALEPIEFEKLPAYRPNYEFLRCDCGGTIGAHDGINVTCIKCGKEFKLYELNYDMLLSNHKTGWFFPVIIRRVE